MHTHTPHHSPVCSVCILSCFYCVIVSCRYCLSIGWCNQMSPLQINKWISYLIFWYLIFCYLIICCLIICYLIISSDILSYLSSVILSSVLLCYLIICFLILCYLIWSYRKVLKSKMKKRVVSIIEADPLPNNAVISNSWIDPKRNKKVTINEDAEARQKCLQSSEDAVEWQWILSDLVKRSGSQGFVCIGKSWAGRLCFFFRMSKRIIFGMGKRFQCKLK